MKFESVRIHFLSDVFDLLLSSNFATMAKWRYDFSHSSTCQYWVTTDSVFTTVYLFSLFICQICMFIMDLNWF